jgi:hypothetical protein
MTLHYQYKQRSIGRIHLWQRRAAFVRYFTYTAALIRHTQWEWELGSLFKWREKYPRWQRYYGIIK